MTSFSDLLQQGATHAWLFVPTAILLGVLHGLEPGHSKTMMAAFIVAVRGTVLQAVLLGLAATASHTAIVWLVALGGLWLGRDWTGESEAYLQLASAVIIVAVALWMAWRTWRDSGPAGAGHHHDGHHHGPHHHAHAHGSHARRDHAHGDHGHGDHGHGKAGALTLGGEDGDAHARAHAADIQRRFAGRHVTTGQIVVFGLTGGLIPCPAAITVLLLCLQLREISLGFVLVLCFGIGLAVTMVSAGVLAAVSVRHVTSRWSGFAILARRAPYASAALIVAIGLYTGWSGWSALARPHVAAAPGGTPVDARPA